MNKALPYFVVLIAVVLTVMNVAIWQKEQILNDGEVVYVKLAPADPRSLMQGDYMRLRYAIDNNIPRNSADKNTNKIVIKTNTQPIAEFVRLDDGTPLSDGEKRFKLSKKRFIRGIKPNTFFFQEGHAKLYETAEYGMFTFAKGKPDNYVLSGLADKNLQKIVPLLKE